jgi:hypothetical protein
MSASMTFDAGDERCDCLLRVESTSSQNETDRRQSANSGRSVPPSQTLSAVIHQQPWHHRIAILLFQQLRLRKSYAFE